MRVDFMRSGWLLAVMMISLGCGAHHKSQSMDDPTTDDPTAMGDAGAGDDAASDIPPADAAPPKTTSAIQILVEPDGKHGSEISAAISAAQKSVHMTMYLLSASDVIAALIARKNAGVDVKVLLAPTLPQGSNQDAFNQLQQAGVAVKWAPSSFTYVHEKAFVVDGKAAWIMTMNATYSAPDSNREYLAIDTDPNDVAETEAIFAGDWAGNPLSAVSGALVVAPLNASALVLGLLQQAKSTIDIEAEELSDYRVVNALELALGRGIKVRIVLPDGTLTGNGLDAANAIKAAGGRIVQVSSPYIHAKAIVIDGKTCFVGSENLSLGSLKYNRELGVIFDTASEVQKVAGTIGLDYGKGVAF